MQNTLAKKIVDSSIWRESPAIRIVWITLLASMNGDGFCQFSTVEALARRARVTSEEASAAVKFLESPDPSSLDPGHEGRRIRRVTYGWDVLNSAQYRRKTRQHNNSAEAL